MKEFGQRLKELREERGLSMDMLVYDLNTKYQIEINKSNISRWENGTVDPSLTYAKCMSSYFDVSLDYMIGLTDVKMPSRILAYAYGMKKAKENKK